MFPAVIYIILNLLLIADGKKVTKQLEDSTTIDGFNDNQDHLNSTRKNGSHKPVEGCYYSLVAPGLLISNRKYAAVISLHDAVAQCTMSISITGPLFNETQNVSLQPFQSKFVEFYPPKLNYGSYTLKAEGVTGCNFSQEKNLLSDVEGGPKMYIQTDKAVYKPKDLIQFHVLFLDEHTRPLSIHEPILVEILDAKNNIVKTFKDVRFNKGVYANSYLLSERPIMGSWSIRVSVSGGYSHSRSKTIEVKKYVLPKFAVYIKTPKHVVVEDGFMKVIVFGKYTFGKYVQGVATVQLWNDINKKMWLEKKIDVKTLAGLELSLENVRSTAESLNVVVFLKENFTGITRNESMKVMLHNQRYNIYANDEDFKFHGFVPYQLSVHIKHWNGAAVVDRKTAVIFNHGEKSYESHIDATGVAKFNFESQPNSGYFIHFKDSILYIPNVYQSRNEINNNVNYCQLKLIGERLRLGAPVKILVSSSEDIPYLVYVIVGHGNIIQMEHITLPPKQNSYTIHIKPTIKMIPISYIYVHYSSDGIFRYNEMELVFPREFENKISLKAPKETQPGQDITVELKAQPQSIVGILAVDLGVHLLDPSYDLQREDIMNELAEDKSYISSKYIENGEFLLCGLVVLTNIKRELIEIKPKKTIRQTDLGPLSYRTQFPEVWIFKHFEVNSTNTKMAFKLPDSITTWRITAFSVNDRTGLGIVDGPTDVIAIKPFFISLNLPYSIKWGEIVAIPILVFNYHSQSLESIITMCNMEQEFEFMALGEDGPQKLENQQIKFVKSIIPANDGQMFSFYIKPLKTGYINLRITATNNVYNDAVHKQLKVEPEGISKNISQAVYFNSKNESSKSSTSLDVITPSNVEPTTNEIALSVGGDYLVPALDNLQNLVGMPTGCGEQNMVHFAPNILVLQYLRTTNNYAKQRELVATIKSFTDSGYQQQLSYRHNNGGYSVFGETVDEEASTWLTAYTIRFFIKASKFTVIERRIIDSGLEYLSDTQLNDGSFPYTGYLFNPAQRNPYALTAFILTTFLEDHILAKKYQSVVDNGIQFLLTDVDNVDDAYALAIVAYVLQIAKNSNVNKVLEKLKIYRNEEDGLTWWSGKDNYNENNVEITAYILMALLDTGVASEFIPILKWLIRQRNTNGGFLSTQDTVVGLQALIKFNKKVASEKNFDLQIKFTAKDQRGDEVKKGEFKVQMGNFMTMQKQELPKTTSNVSVDVSGTGSALVQLTHRYKLLDAAIQISPMIAGGTKFRKKNAISNTETNDVKYFVIKPKANILNNDNLDLEIGFSFKNKTNMVIMEVNLPSGYATDDETLEDLKNNAFIQRIEPRNAYTTIILYLDKLPVDVDNYINILAYKTSEVLLRKPVPIVMYDYYNTKFYNSIFYNI